MNYIKEISQLRTYNSKTFFTDKTKETRICTSLGVTSRYGGELMREFHIKPIHYIGVDGRWHDLDEVAFYFGNKNGMTLYPSWEEKIDMGYLGWYLKRQKLINGRGINIGIPLMNGAKKLELPLLLNLTLIQYPDPSPETTTCDGNLSRGDTADETWTTIRAGVGQIADTTASTINAPCYVNSVTANQFSALRRGHTGFDTISLSSRSTISSATVGYFGSSKLDDVGSADLTFDIVSSTPASNNALVTGDYGNLGSASWSTASISYANFNTSAYNTLTLNAAGLAGINKTGVSNIGVKAGKDISGVQPTYGGSTQQTRTIWKSSETSGVASDPKLTVVFTLASGTINYDGFTLGQNILVAT